MRIADFVVVLGKDVKKVPDNRSRQRVRRMGRAMR